MLINKYLDIARVWNDRSLPVL